MMTEAFSLEQVLIDQGYIKVVLTQNKVGHFQVQGWLNGIPIDLILDTGASGSVIDLESADRYGLPGGSSRGKSQWIGGVGSGNGKVRRE